ncbi:hypothetical protein BH09SUM1_BH09SUM1_05190 [soil metagenome]
MANRMPASKTKLLNGNDPAHIQSAAGILMSGGLVAFPTETVYGLGADATNEAAVRAIFDAKGRPGSNSGSFLFCVIVAP